VPQWTAESLNLGLAKGFEVVLGESLRENVGANVRKNVFAAKTLTGVSPLYVILW
jgi:hypothetical protein